MKSREIFAKSVGIIRTSTARARSREEAPGIGEVAGTATRLDYLIQLDPVERIDRVKCIGRQKIEQLVAITCWLS